MNTKSVEDGTADAFNEGVKAAAKVFEGAGMIHNEVYALLKPSAAVPVANLDELLRNVRSATPEELTAQRESYSKNYTPGPIQATPFMPEALIESPEELPPLKGYVRTNGMIASISDRVTLYQNPECADHFSDTPFYKPSPQPTLPVPERTSCEKCGGLQDECICPEEEVGRDDE